MRLITSLFIVGWIIFFTSVGHAISPPFDGFVGGDIGFLGGGNAMGGSYDPSTQIYEDREGPGSLGLNNINFLLGQATLSVSAQIDSMNRLLGGTASIVGEFLDIGIPAGSTLLQGPLQWHSFDLVEGHVNFAFFAEQKHPALGLSDDYFGFRLFRFFPSLSGLGRPVGPGDTLDFTMPFKTFGGFTGSNLYSLQPILEPSEPIPEPSTMLLMGSGLIGLVGWRWWSTKIT